MARLNGWRRLWVVVSSAWAVWWVAIILILWFTTNEEGEVLRVFLPVAVVPPVLLYAAGLGVAWIRRGFQQRKA